MQAMKFQSLLTLFLLTAVSSAFGQAKDENSQQQSPQRSDNHLAIQLFLDAHSFGPGRIDAMWGQFTSKAAKRWNEVNPDNPITLDETGNAKADIGKKLWGNQPLLTDYTLTQEDLKMIGELPAEPADKATKEALPYESATELVAEKYHAAADYIKALNPDVASNPGAGTTFKVPNVKKPFDLSAPQAIKDAGRETNSAGKNQVVTVNRQTNILELEEDGKLVCSFPITPGSDSTPAPEGDWEVDVIAWMPEFRYDEQMLKEGKRSDNAHMLPPGPNNPVGIVWIGLSADGIGLHGTSNPDDIGRNASAGCVRLANWDALDLGKRLAVGTKVVIK